MALTKASLKAHTKEAAAEAVAAEAEELKFPQKNCFRDFPAYASLSRKQFFFENFLKKFSKNLTFLLAPLFRKFGVHRTFLPAP